MLNRIVMFSLAAVALWCAGAPAAQAQSFSEWSPCGVDIHPSGTSAYASCGVPIDTNTPIIVGSFQPSAPGWIAFEIAVDCYNNPQHSNPPSTFTTGWTTSLASLGCPATARYWGNPRLQLWSQDSSTTYTYGN